MSTSVSMKPTQRKANDIFSHFHLSMWFAMLRGSALPSSVMTSPYKDFGRKDKIAVVYFAAANSFKLLSCACGFYVVVTHVFKAQGGNSLFSSKQLEDMNWVLAYVWTLILIPGNIWSTFRTRAVLLDFESSASNKPRVAYKSNVERLVLTTHYH